MKKTLSFLLLGLLSVCNLQADFVPFNDGYYNDGLLPQTQLSFSNGWRWDRIRRHEKNFLLDNTRTGDSLEKIKDISVWEVGLQGTLSLPNSYCDCGWDWLSQFYIDGYAYWGNIGNGGKRSYKSFLADGAFNGSSTRHARAGETHNYQIALGWLLPISCEFGIAPIVGYSWDELSIRPSSLIKFNPPPVEPPVASTAEWSTYKWKGPFLGFNLVYDLCDFRLDVGYEYHWLKNKTALNNNRFDVDLENCVARKLTSRYRDASGQVGYLDVTWNICDCWALALGAKFRDYDAGKSKRSRPSPEINEEICGYSTFSSSWQSWELTFDVAYRF